MQMNLGTRFRFFNINIHIHNTENPMAAVVAASTIHCLLVAERTG